MNIKFKDTYSLNQWRTTMAVLTSDKIDFMSKICCCEKWVCFIMING